MLQKQKLGKSSPSYLILLVVVIFAYSCKKDAFKTQTIKDKIDGAKAWYLDQTKNTTNYLKSKRGDSILIINEPQWDEVQTEVLDDESLAIILPIKTNLYEISRKEGDLTLVIHYKDNSYDFKLLNRFKENISDTTKLSPGKLYELAFPKKIGGFQSTSKVFNLLSDNLTISKAMRLKINKLQSLSGLNDKAVMSSSCTHFFWVEKYWENEVVVHEEWTYMYSIGCGGNGVQPGEEYPTPDEGSPQNDPSPFSVNIDTSVLNNSKARCALFKMMNVAQFNYLIRAFNNKGFNLVFNVKTTLTNTGSRGETKNSSGQSNFEINLRRSFVNSSPPIHIAKTLLHEAFHANLMQKAYEVFGSTEINNNWVRKPENMELDELMDIIESKGAGTNFGNVMHEYMANHINIIADGLQEFALTYDAYYPNYDKYDYLALAWEGLTGTTYYIDNIKDNQIYYIPNTSIHMRADSLFSIKFNNVKNDSQVNCDN